MESKVNIKGHPLHVILVMFPAAFLSGAFLFDLIGWIANVPELLTTAYYAEIAGIIFALIAAIPGLIDLIHSVPPKSTAKKRGIKHGIINVSHTLIFTVAWIYRHQPDASLLLILALELVGTILIGFAGWLGGTLVYRNMIGVNPRYAGAGRWKEITIEKLDGTTPIGEVDELKLNQMKLIRTKLKRYVLARAESGYTVFDDHCTHHGGSLAGGAMICGTVQCPWHGSQFDVFTGQVKEGPATVKISAYKVIEKDGKLYASDPALSPMKTV